MEAAVNFILITGINAVLLMIILLIKRQNKSKHHFILVSLLIFYLFVIIDAYASHHSIRSLKGASYFFSDTVGFYSGPTLFLYVWSIFNKEGQLLAKSWFHYIPFLIYGALVTLPSQLAYNGFASSDYVRFLHDHTFIYHIQPYYLLFYCLYTIWLLRSKKSNLSDHYSSLDYSNLLWIQSMLIGLSCTMVYYILASFGDEAGFIQSTQIELYTTFIFVVTIVFLGYYGLSQTKLFIPEWHKEIKKQLSSNTDPIGLSKEEAQLLKSNLTDLINHKKPHLDPSLRLIQLADMLDISPKKLTLVLNQYMGVSFYEFINAKRVQEFKRLIKSGHQENYTLLATAKESGFNSKTSFNRIFKKMEGITPRQYIANQV